MGVDQATPDESAGLGRKRSEEEAARAWIERHVRESPPFSEEQLRRMGEILGLRLTRKSSATQA